MKSKVCQSTFFKNSVERAAPIKPIKHSPNSYMPLFECAFRNLNGSLGQLPDQKPFSTCEKELNTYLESLHSISKPGF